jgi:DNA-binding NarL/FixJ family response regulator
MSIKVVYGCADLVATVPPFELQIAQLAAVGLSNREIGERLYLSPRTISTHLYRVFPPKLGVTTRSQLGTALTPATALIP